MIETFSDTVGLIYDAAANATAWPAALQQVSALFGASSTSLIVRDMQTLDGRAISTLDHEGQREFWRWRDNNPFATRARTPRPRSIETDRDILPRRELVRTAYYNEFWAPLDTRGVLMIWLDRQGPVQQYLSIAGPGEFERADIDVAKLLAPHLRRAVMLNQQLGGSRISDADASALDALGQALVLIDETGAPMHVNRAGERLLATRDGLSVHAGRLFPSAPSCAARLDALLAQAAGIGGMPPASGAMRLPRPSGKPPLAIVAVPLCRDIDWLRPRRPAACLCIIDPEARPSIPVDWLRALFGLTAAEADVATALLAGDDNREIADRLGIRYHTVRAHLARIMAKTATSRQAELVQMLSTVATLHGEAG